MHALTAVVFTAVFSVVAPAVALADPIPRGAKPASREKISKAYVGKTDLWDSGCGGGIYFSPSGQARAWCKESSDSLGAGTWSIDANGNLCQDLTWYWPNTGTAGASPGADTCISHVVDRWGQLWRSWPGDENWWPVDRNAGLVRGYKFQSQILDTRSKLGF